MHPAWLLGVILGSLLRSSLHAVIFIPYDAQTLDVPSSGSHKPRAIETARDDAPVRSRCAAIASCRRPPARCIFMETRPVWTQSQQPQHVEGTRALRLKMSSGAVATASDDDDDANE